MPRIAATLDSMADTADTCRGVAPTRRMAANRCSRRAADSRLAVPMKISTGNSSPAATQDRIRSMPLASMPTPSTHCSPLQLLGGIVWMLVTSRAPGWWASWAGVRPTMTSREFGEGSAAAPIVPTWWPGNRSASSLAGWSCSSRVSAGEA